MNLNSYSIIFSSNLKLIWIDKKFKLSILTLPIGLILICFKYNTFFLIKGTALQNRLKELWVLYSFIFGDSLLGSHKIFQITFSGPIEHSRTKDATNRQKAYGTKMAKLLKEKIKPYYLRRTKGDIQQQTNGWLYYVKFYIFSVHLKFLHQTMQTMIEK